MILNKVTLSPSLIYKMGGMFGQKGISVEHFASQKELLSHLHFNAKKLKNIQMSNGDDIIPDLITTLMSDFNSKDKALIIQEIASTFYKPISQIVSQ